MVLEEDTHMEVLQQSGQASQIFPQRVFGALTLKDFFLQCGCSLFHQFLEMLVEVPQVVLSFDQFEVSPHGGFVSRKQKVENLLPLGGDEITLTRKQDFNPQLHL